jgi:DNA-binding NarL/FixJ family response regulator
MRRSEALVAEFAQTAEDDRVELVLGVGVAAPGSASDPPDSIRRLARMLAHRAEEVADVAGGPRPSPGDVLLDFDADGIRCLLVVSHVLEQRSEIRLSPREVEIAGMVAEGYPNKTIAAKLQISSWTVSSYLRRVFVKLSVHTRTAMVVRLFERGLIDDHGEPLSTTVADEEAGRPASGVRMGSAATHKQ